MVEAKGEEIKGSMECGPNHGIFSEESSFTLDHTKAFMESAEVIGAPTISR